MFVFVFFQKSYSHDLSVVPVVFVFMALFHAAVITDSTFPLIQWIRILDLGLLDPAPMLRIAALRGFSELTQNWIRSSHGHSAPFLKISCKSVQPFSRNLADKETKKDTNKETKKSIENNTPSPFYRGVRGWGNKGQSNILRGSGIDTLVQRTYF